MKKTSTITIVFFLLLMNSTLFLYHAGSLLSDSDTEEKADIILCLSGSAKRLAKAVELCRSGIAPKIIVTSDLAYSQATQLNIDKDALVKPAWSANSTYEEGVLFREALMDENIQKALVVSDDYHLFRVKWTLEKLLAKAYPDMKLLYVGAETNPGPEYWWKYSNSRIFVLSELHKIVYYWVWHGLLGKTEDNTLATQFEEKYMKVLWRIFG